MKKNLRKIAAASLALSMLLVSMAGCGSATTSKSSSSAAASGAAGKTQKVEIAILTGMAPYTYVDDKGDFQGYDYEALKMIDELLPEYEFHYNAVEPDAAAAAIQAGTYALSSSAHFVTPAREKNFILSKPVSYYPVNLISRKADSFKKFEDLNGKVIVPNPPNDGLYVVLYEMAKKFPNVKFKQEEVSNYIPYADGCRGVANKTYDIWFGGDTMFYDIMKQEPMELFCSDPIYCAACVVVINKDQTALRDGINKSIDTLYADGSLSKLSTKWLDKDVFEIAKQTGALKN